MSWITSHVRRPKDPSYAKRVLDRYRLGMKAGGAIRGVRVLAGADSCAACRAAAQGEYLPNEAPIIPIAGCTHPEGCRCAYAPVMDYDERAFNVQIGEWGANCQERWLWWQALA
jgi:hypothetical protein